MLTYQKLIFTTPIYLILILRMLTFHIVILVMQILQELNGNKLN